MNDFNRCSNPQKHNPLKGISKLSRCEIIALVSSASLLLSEGLDDEDMDMLGSLLASIGDMISTFGAIADSECEQENEEA